MDVADFIFGCSASTIFLGIATVVFLYWYSTRNHSYWKDRGIKYVPPYPFVGSSIREVVKPLKDLDLQRHFKYGKVYGYYEGNKPALTVADPGLLKNIMVKDFHVFSGRRTLPTFDKTVGNMLVAAQGETWKRIRSIVSRTFTSGKLRLMMNIFKESAETVVQNFRMAAEKNEPVDTKRLFGAFTMDVIASSAFSTKITSHNDPDNQFAKTARDLFIDALSWRFFLLGFFPSIMTILNIDMFAPSRLKFFHDVVNQIIEERNKTGQTRIDFLQLMLDSAKEVEKEENSDEFGKEKKDATESTVNADIVYVESKHNMPIKNISFDELISQSLSFFIAGYPTTTSTLSLATYSLALNEEVQDKVRAEVDKVLEEHKGELTYEAIQSMRYLDNFVCEVLRLYPPGAKGEREAKDNYELGDTGITIPKGMIVSIPIYAIHRDPQYYPDPEKFDPDRFCPEERAKRDPFTYIPFGAGPRHCVGMRFALLEIKVCLVYLISNVKIKRCSKTQIPVDYAIGMGLLQPKDIFVGVEVRENRPLIK